MFCPKCGSNFGDDALFCGSCGENLSRYTQHQSQNEQPAAIMPETIRKSRWLDTSEASTDESDPARGNGDPSGSSWTALQKVMVIFLAVVILSLALVLIYLFFGSASAKSDQPEGGAAVMTDEVSVYSAEFPGAVASPSVPTSELPEATARPPENPVEIPESAPMSPAPAGESKNDYLVAGSDSRFIDESDLDTLSWKECSLARNEIYARHGRKFKNNEVTEYFNDCFWYSGTREPKEFDAVYETVLNDYEMANIAFIVKYEKDKFGGSYY